MIVQSLSVNLQRVKSNGEAAAGFSAGARRPETEARRRTTAGVRPLPAHQQVREHRAVMHRVPETPSHTDRALLALEEALDAHVLALPEARLRAREAKVPPAPEADGR